MELHSVASRAQTVSAHQSTPGSGLSCTSDKITHRIHQIMILQTKTMSIPSFFYKRSHNTKSNWQYQNQQIIATTWPTPRHQLSCSYAKCHMTSASWWQAHLQSKVCVDRCRVWTNWHMPYSHYSLSVRPHSFCYKLQWQLQWSCSVQRWFSNSTELEWTDLPI